MLTGILLIIIAWCTDMPLWLSIVTTVVGGLEIICDCKD